MPGLSTPEALYDYYRVKECGDTEVYIRKDLKRTQIGNESFAIDPDTGKNPLYNVLRAYGSFDPEIGYC